LKKKKPKQEDVFLPYWLDVQKQLKTKLYDTTTTMTALDMVKRTAWLICCFTAAVLISGRSCGI